MPHLPPPALKADLLSLLTEGRHSDVSIEAVYGERKHTQLPRRSASTSWPLAPCSALLMRCQKSRQIIFSLERTTDAAASLRGLSATAAKCPRPFGPYLSR